MGMTHWPSEANWGTLSVMILRRRRFCAQLGRTLQNRTSGTRLRGRFTNAGTNTVTSLARWGGRGRTGDGDIRVFKDVQHHTTEMVFNQGALDDDLALSGSPLPEDDRPSNRVFETARHSLPVGGPALAGPRRSKKKPTRRAALGLVRGIPYRGSYYS
jgi:hypothetical protein